MTRHLIPVLFTLLVVTTGASLPGAAPADVPVETPGTSMIPENITPEQAREAVTDARNETRHLLEERRDIERLNEGLGRLNITAPAPPSSDPGINRSVEEAEAALERGDNRSALANATQARQQINRSQGQLTARFAAARSNASHQLGRRTARLEERLQAEQARIQAAEQAGLLGPDEASEAMAAIQRAQKRIEAVESNISSIDNATTTDELLSSANQTSQLLDETEDDIKSAQSAIDAAEQPPTLPTTLLLQTIAVLGGAGFLYWRLGRRQTAEQETRTDDKQEQEDGSDTETGTD